MAALSKEEGGTFIAGTWRLRAGEVGEAFSESGYPLRMVQAQGAFTGLAEVVIEGSNIGGPDENWKVLSDAQGNPLALARADLLRIGDCPRHTRARVMRGDELTDITVCIFAVRAR